MDKVRLFVTNKKKIINTVGSDITPEAAARNCYFWIDTAVERQEEI